MTLNAAQVHLLLNHFPVILPMVGLIVLAWGLLRDSLEIKEVGLIILVGAALATIPTYLTGKPAEDFLKNYPGVSRMAMETHEEAAEKALIALEILGGLSLITLVLQKLKKRVRNGFFITIFVVGLVGLVLVARAAHLGGFVRHEEIRSDRYLQSPTP